MELKICENCGNEHDGKYASGRFCSVKCSAGFSTKLKRKEINEKVKKTAELKNPKVERTVTCSVCATIFKTHKKHKHVCSKACVGKIGGTTLKKDTSKMGGIRDGGGKTKVYAYVNLAGETMKLNSFEIKVAEVLDSLKLNWNRNWKGFNYTTLDGNERKYYPDFYVSDFDAYVEFKGWVTEHSSHKMNDAAKKNNLKLIIIYSIDKRYKELGINIKEIIDNPNILINEMK